MAALLGGGERAGELVPQVAERSGGNPLFAEEMVRRLAEEEGDGIAELPDTVQAVLAARLDALDPFERRLVQQASVVGRTFWEGSLAPLAEEEGRDLGDGARRACRTRTSSPPAPSRAWRASASWRSSTC